MTLGIDLNNPGDLEVGGPPFLGQVGSHGKFLKFIDPIHGLRAIIMRLMAYQENDGCMNLHDMIYRWAPPEDNNPTAAYLTNVAKATGLSPDPLAPTVDLTDPTNISNLMTAITQQEQGSQPYSTFTIQRAVSMVLASQGGTGAQSSTS